MSRNEVERLTRGFRAYVQYQQTSSFDQFQAADPDAVAAVADREETIVLARAAKDLEALRSPKPQTAAKPSRLESVADHVQTTARKPEKPANQLWKTMEVVHPVETFENLGEIEGENATERLASVRSLLGDCTRCDLCASRTNIVFGVGNPDARLMIVGEAPGFNEDKQAEPFVGKAGELLDKMVVAMGLSREEIYIANVLKCRPPQNRDPLPGEVQQCAPFLKKQIAVIQPEVIVTMGKFASNTLAGTDGALGKIRGNWMSYQGIAMMPTYHPAYLLRNESAKRYAWEDLKKVMSKLGLGS